MPEKPAGQVEQLQVDAATRRPGGRTARTAKAVLDATIAELGDVGYAALRIETVAERAGVNRATIYRRWGDKPSLVAAAFTARQVEVSPPEDTGDLFADLLAFLREVRRGFDSPWITALIKETDPRAADNDGLRQALDKIWPARFRLSREIFVRAVERGDLPAGTDPDFLVQAAAGPLYFRWLMLGHPLTDDFLRHTAALVIAGARHA